MFCPNLVALQLPGIRYTQNIFFQADASIATAESGRDRSAYRLLETMRICGTDLATRCFPSRSQGQMVLNHSRGKDVEENLIIRDGLG
jgi:hypothetical protein